MAVRPHPDQQAERRASAPALANIIWVVVAGWWLALAHIVAGVAQCVTIIGIPFGIANFKLVPVAFWPLGREIVDIDREPHHHTSSATA